MHPFLNFLHQATPATEGQKATIDQVLLTMESLLEQLEIDKLEYAGDPYTYVRAPS